MHFHRATDLLIRGVTLKDLAAETGTSHGVLRLARLDPSNPGHCHPPVGWEKAALKLARRRAAQLSRLIDQLSRASQASGRLPASKRSRVQKSTRRTKPGKARPRRARH